MEGDRITGVTDGYVVAAPGDTVVDLRQATLPPLEFIKAATIESARLLGMEEQLGTVDAGKLADLVAVEGDPIANIRQMTKVVFVMKGGRVYTERR